MTYSIHTVCTAPAENQSEILAAKSGAKPEAKPMATGQSMEMEKEDD